MRIGSLFAGVGGLELGLEWSGLGKTIWQVEKSESSIRVLEKHWPGVERFGDVTEVGKKNLREVDLICGGFPCQDVSTAGKGAGLDGSRSGLWYEFLRIVKELSPPWVVVENVASGAKRWVDQVRGSLEFEGYATFPIPLSAKDCGALHLRKRIFIVAHANGLQKSQQEGVIENERGWISHEGENVSHADSKQAQWSTVARCECDCWLPEPDMGRVANGVPRRVDRLKQLGNAVVPQCAQVIGEFIKQLEEEAGR